MKIVVVGMSLLFTLVINAAAVADAGVDISARTVDDDSLEKRQGPDCHYTMGCAGEINQVTTCVGSDYSCKGVKSGAHPVLESGGVYNPKLDEVMYELSPDRVNGSLLLPLLLPPYIIYIIS